MTDAQFPKGWNEQRLNQLLSELDTRTDDEWIAADEAAAAMKEYLFADRVNTKIREYEKIFSERGEFTPSDPLEFHLFHLARYWSRLVGFCRQDPSKPEHWINGDLGACVAVGSEFAQQLIGPSSPIYSLWQEYWSQTQAILYERPVTFEAVVTASQAFDACVAQLKYDPWK